MQFSTHFPHAVSHFLVFFCFIIMFSYFLVQFSIMIQANYLYTCNLMYLQMFLNRKNLFLSHRFPPDTVLRICTVAYHFLLFRCHCLWCAHCRPAVIWTALFPRNLVALDTVFSPWYKPLYTGPSRSSPFISLRSTHISFFHALFLLLSHIF